MKTIIKTISVIFLISIFFSCSIEKRIAKAKLLAISHPTAFADFCASAYPVLPTYIKGKDSTITETTYKRDTVIVIRYIDGKANTIKVPCPPCEQKTKTVFRTDTITKENTAKTQVAQNQINELNIKLANETQAKATAEKNAKQRLWWIAGIIAVFVAIIFLRK